MPGDHRIVEMRIGGVLASPEKRALVEAIDDARVARALEVFRGLNLASRSRDGELDALLSLIEKRAIPFVAEPHYPAKTIPLTPDRIAEAKSIAAEAISARGGSYRPSMFMLAGCMTWRSDGRRLWTEL